jgi:hypothetical protein
MLTAELSATEKALHHGGHGGHGGTQLDLTSVSSVSSVVESFFGELLLDIQIYL